MAQKIKYFLPLLLSTLTLSSCQTPFGFPSNSDDPEIIALIEFSNNFKLQTCLDTYLYADLDYVATDSIFENEVETIQGKHTVDFTFSREVDTQWFSNHVEYLEGTLKSDDYPNLCKFERTITPRGDGRYDYLTLHDGVRVDSQSTDNISQADVYTKLYPFYATPGGIADGQVNGGGMYFGDEVLMNANQYWKHMHVDKEQNLLISTYENMPIEKNAVANVEYAVNIHGMLICYKQSIKIEHSKNKYQIAKFDIFINYTK